MICTPRKSESLMIWTTLAPKLTPFGTSACNPNHINTGRQARLKAGARHERTLEAVACTCWLGLVWRGRWALGCVWRTSWGTGHHHAVFCGLLRLEKLPQRLHVILEFGC
jgi:hypothetical protein